MDDEPNLIQGSLFEEDYLRRTLGPLANMPDMALTELVANAWDAGACLVDINIPSSVGEAMAVADDGSGMTPTQFKKRWMTLGYDRVRHQGDFAEFPPERSDWRRAAYGRAGMGRHALLCFADQYEVETVRDGKRSTFTVTTKRADDPFALIDESVSEADGHGTRLSCVVARNLPDPEELREILASRFLSDPQFKIQVNSRSVPLTEHSGLLDKRVLSVDGISVEVLFFELEDTSKRVLQHGIAFWVGKRLVGQPTWTIGDRVLLDGRTRLAKRHTVVVKSDQLLGKVLSDWTGFRPDPLMSAVYAEVADYVEERVAEAAAGKIHATKEEVLTQHRPAIERLQPLARLEVAEFVHDLATKHPTMPQEVVSAAVGAAIRLEKKRSGAELLQRLSGLSDDDIEGLNRLLKEWTVRDALTVLDEVDRRIAVIEALQDLADDPKVDELGTLHPLVTQARWLFGPEFDSPEFASNVSLVNAAKVVFRKTLTPSSFSNARKRPDLVVLEDSSVSVTGTEHFQEGSALVQMQAILVVELKRGGSTIGRDEMNQATGYVEDFLSCGAIEGTPYVSAFVVGHKVADKLLEVHRVGDRPEVGKVTACSYGQLVRTAAKRLFGLRERLSDRYADEAPDALLERVLHSPTQRSLDFEA